MIATRSKSGATDAPPRPPVQFPPGESEASRRELVRRIVHSPTFVRSERLITLLTYVCDMTFNGHEAEISEQKIGAEVFGRSQDYDTAVDGIVRSQASRLRQRLELYFQQEGANEPVRVVIPRGGYVPVFETQSAPVRTPSGVDLMETTPEVAPAQLNNINPRDSFSRRWLPWGLSLILGLMLMGLWLHDRQRQVSGTASLQTHPFWSHLFTKDQRTMVVAPDSGLVLFHGLSGREIDLKGYLDAGYRSESNGSPQVGPTAAQKDWLLDLANRRYTSMVDVDAMLGLKDRARSLGSEVTVRYARDLRPNDFKTGTAILLGMSSANPWVELFEHDMNFVLKDDFTKFFWVVNRNPQKGEPTQWVSVRNDPQRRVFGVVAYVPNLARDGNTLIIEGISMSGTEAAMDFVNDDAQLLPFLNRIRRPDGILPHFELLLETHNMGASAVQSQILAWRIMN